MVDDEVMIATLIAEIIIEEFQMESIQAFSAEEAIEELQRQEFSLVISDIRMPGIGGFGLLNWIQTHLPPLKERFVFVTGCAGGPTAEQALEALKVPIIQKPFTCGDLIQCCRELLTNFEQRLHTSRPVSAMTFRAEANGPHSLG